MCCVLVKREIPKSSLPIYVRTQRKNGSIWTRKGFSPDMESVAALILDISTYSSVRNQCLMLINHPIFGIFVIAAQMDVRQAHKDFSIWRKRKSSCLVSLLTRTVILLNWGPTLPDLITSQRCHLQILLPGASTYGNVGRQKYSAHSTTWNVFSWNLPLPYWLDISALAHVIFPFSGMCYNWCMYHNLK